MLRPAGILAAFAILLAMTAGTGCSPESAVSAVAPETEPSEAEADLTPIRGRITVYQSPG